SEAWLFPVRLVPFFLVESGSSVSFLSLLKREVIPAKEFLRASFPSLRIMMDAEDTVEEREMLSVEAFKRELNREAARERFLTGESVGGTSGLGAVGLVLASSGRSSRTEAEV